MANATVSAREVITFSEGTLTIVRGQRENENALGVAFFDKNRNGALDEADQKILVDPLQCPKAGKKIESAGKIFCLVRVAKEDINHYGQAVGGIWKQVWSDRSELLKAVKPQSEGLCTIDAEKVEEPLISTTLQVKFRPTLSLKSKTASAAKRYTASELRKIVQETEDVPVVDPERCYEAESSFKAQLSGRELNMKLSISGKHYGFVSFYAGLHEILGLRSLAHLPHISYDNGTTDVHHVNVK